MRILILAEHNNKEVKSSTLNTISAASKINSEIEVLVVGFGIDEICKQICSHQDSTTSSPLQIHSGSTPESTLNPLQINSMFLS